MKRLFVRIAFVAFALSLVPVCGPVLAQDDDSAEAAAPAEEREFADEVTVTARKREEDIQDVPFSGVAPTEEVLRDRGAETLSSPAASPLANAMGTT